MRSMRRRPLHEELGIERDATPRLGIELHHPTIDPVGIELRIDGAVERIGEVDAAAVTADLDHLRSAAECTILGAWMSSFCDNAADAHLAGKLRIEGIGHVVLL